MLYVSSLRLVPRVCTLCIHNKFAYYNHSNVTEDELIHLNALPCRSIPDKYSSKGFSIHCTTSFIACAHAHGVTSGCSHPAGPAPSTHLLLCLDRPLHDDFIMDLENQVPTQRFQFIAFPQLQHCHHDDIGRAALNRSVDGGAHGVHVWFSSSLSAEVYLCIREIPPPSAAHTPCHIHPTSFPRQLHLPSSVKT